MRNRTIQIRVTDLIHSILKHRRMIIVLTAVGLAIGIVLSVVAYMRGEMSKQYAISSSFAVTSVTENGLFTTNTNNPNSNDIYLAQNMVDSVVYVMKSDRLLNAAIDKLNLVGIGNKDISSNLSMKQYNETQIVEMTLYWRSADEGVQILTAINDVAPMILIDTLKIGGVSVVNEPKSRYIVGGNMNMSTWLYTAMMGLVAGIGFSVLQLLFRPTLINTGDMENVLDVQVLGEIPRGPKQQDDRRIPRGDDITEAYALMNEYYMSAAHVLHNRLDESGEHCIFVTSAVPGEGKSTVAANLALQLAELQYRVLLIDMDMRNPSLAAFFLKKAEYEHSLNALYRGDAELHDVIARVHSCLDFIPAIMQERTLPLDEAMLSLIRPVMDDYEYVIIDTSPVGRAAQAMNLKRITSQALFVVRHDVTAMRDITQSLERMEKAGIEIVGCIVNQVKKPGQDANLGYYGRKRLQRTNRQLDVASVPQHQDPAPLSDVRAKAAQVKEPDTVVQAADTALQPYETDPVLIPVPPVSIPAGPIKEEITEDALPEDEIRQERTDAEPLPEDDESYRILAGFNTAGGVLLAAEPADDDPWDDHWTAVIPEKTEKSKKSDKSGKKAKKDKDGKKKKKKT